MFFLKTNSQLWWYENSLQEITWDIESAIVTIWSTYKEQFLEKNTFILNFWHYSGQNWFIIYCLLRNICFKVDEKLALDLWIQHIFNLLYKFSAHAAIAIEWCRVRWSFNDICSSFEKVILYTYDDLLQYSLFTQVEKIWNTYSAISKFSYELLSHIKIETELISNISWWEDNNRWIAIAKSESEAIERYSASAFWDWWNTIKTKATNVALAPHIMWDSILQQDIDCQLVSSLTGHDKDCYIPNEMLYYPYNNWVTNYSCTSSWMATHPDENTAILNWLIELIERDTFLVFWLLKTGAKELENIENIMIQEEIDYSTIKVRIFLLEIDNPIPVILILAQNKSKQSFISVSAWFDLESTCLKGLKSISKNQWLLNWDNDFSELHENIMPVMHMKDYLDPWNHHKLLWLEQLDTIDYWLLSKKYRINSKTKLIEYYSQLWIGFWVYKYNNRLNQVFKRVTYKVFSDSLLPLYFWKVPDYIKNSIRLLWIQKKRNIKEINLDIHPLS